MKIQKWLFIFVVLGTPVASVRGDAKPKPAQPQRVTHRIAGLCCRERESDLRDAVKTMKGVSLVGIDFDNSEATFLYDMAALYPQDRPEHYTEIFDNLLRTASDHTFSVLPPSTVPKDRLTLVEIRVSGLDCKGCCLGTYNAIARIDGVARATACSREGRVTALIDTAKTNRAALEAALKQAGVGLPSSEK